MSISSEITRISTLRNTIRAKLISLGITSDESANLEDCSDCINGISRQNSLVKIGGTVSGMAGYYPNTVSQTVTASDVTSGTKRIVSNSYPLRETVDVTTYASALVSDHAALPAEYQEVEYIENLGGARIDSGVWASSNIHGEIVFSFNGYFEDSSYSAICSSANHRYLFHFRHTRGSDIHSEIGWDTTEYYHTAYFDIDKIYHLHSTIGCTTKISTGSFRKYGFVFNCTDTEIMECWSNSSTSAPSATSANIGIFARKNDNGTYSYNTGGKLYSLKLSTYEDGLIRHFIPCYRKSDNVIGLYDIIGAQFYANNGSGHFEKGADVL